MAFVPDRGEVIWIDFDPQAGREQARHRPALVLSPKAYNSKTSLCVVCPITSQTKVFGVKFARCRKSPEFPARSTYPSVSLLPNVASLAPSLIRQVDLRCA